MKNKYNFHKIILITFLFLISSCGTEKVPVEPEVEEPIYLNTNELTKLNIDNPIYKDVLIFYYNPIINRDEQIKGMYPCLETDQNNPIDKSLIECFKWKDPKNTATLLATEISTLSGGVLNYIIKDENYYRLNDFPIKETGYQFDIQSYLNCYSGIGNCNIDMADYTKMLGDPLIDGKSICQIATEKNINEIWFFGGKNYGLFESKLISNSQIYINSPSVDVTSCLMPTIVMGFELAPIYDNFNILDPTSSKYEEQKKDLLLENPLHSYGHRIERIMKYIFQNRKSYSFELNADKSIKVISKNIKSNEFDLFYSYYYRQTYEENGLKPPSFSNNDINNAHCGEIHFPPNTDTSYDYRNEINKVYSDCNLLYMYYPETTNPNLEIFQNQKDYINCDPWGCTMYGYQKWWMKHIPNFEGGHENAFDLGPSLILNNWWRYISNPQKLVEIVNEMIYTGPGFVQMNSEAKIT